MNESPVACTCKDVYAGSAKQLQHTPYAMICLTVKRQTSNTFDLKCIQALWGGQEATCGGKR